MSGATVISLIHLNIFYTLKNLNKSFFVSRYIEKSGNVDQTRKVVYRTAALRPVSLWC